MNVFFVWVGLMIGLNVLKPETVGLYRYIYLSLTIYIFSTVAFTADDYLIRYNGKC